MCMYLAVVGALFFVGIIKMPSIATNGEAARIAFYQETDSNGRSFANLKNLFKDRLIFQLFAKYSIKPEFYSKEHMYHPIDVTYQLNHLGNSSYNMLDIARSIKTGHVIHEGLIVQVAVNRQTRKAMALPHWYKEKFGRLTKGEMWAYTTPVKPLKTFVNPYRVVWSDTDYYYHVNQASYIRIAMDTIAEAGVKNQFANLEGDPGRLKVKEMRMLYAAETKPHNTLVIHVWRDENHRKIIHCQIEKDDNPDGQSVFYMSTEYY